MLAHRNKQAYQSISLLFLFFWFENQSNKDAEENGGADAGCRGGEAACEYAEKSIAFDCLFNTLGKRIAEAFWVRKRRDSIFLYSRPSLSSLSSATTADCCPERDTFSPCLPRCLQ